MKKLVCLISCSLSHWCSGQTWEWARIIPAPPYTYMRDMVSDGAGNSYIAFEVTNAGSFDVLSVSPGYWIAKYDPGGMLTWLKKYPVSSIAVNDEAIYTCGKFSGSQNLGGSTFTSSGATDMVMLKLDLSGNLLAFKIFGGPGEDQANKIVLDELGNTYVTGSYEDQMAIDGHAFGGSPWYNYFILKADAALAYTWADTDTTALAYGYDIALSSQDVFVAGRANFFMSSGHFINHYTPAGDLARQIIQEDGPAGSEYHIGFTGGTLCAIASISSTHTTDFSFFRYDSLLEVSYERPMGASYHYAIGTGMIPAGNGSLFFNGNAGNGMTDSCLVDSVWVEIHGGEGDTYIVRTDSMGKIESLLPAYSRDGAAIDFLSKDAFSNVYAFGRYYNYVHEDSLHLGSLIVPITPGGTRGFFLAKAAQTVLTGSNGVITEQYVQVNLGPNPSAGVIALSSTSPLLGIVVYDDLGKLIMIKSVDRSLASGIDLSHCKKGIYFVEAETEKGVIVKKVLLN
ncbi:MAG: T9SS type A sorting domain-containing protein [Bacteroidia bacterium]